MSKNSADGQPTPLVTNELIVAYDIMWEAANRLRGLHVQEIRNAEDDDAAIRKLWEIRDEVEAVDPDDIVAQRAMTEKLRREYAERLRAEAQDAATDKADVAEARIVRDQMDASAAPWPKD